MPSMRRRSRDLVVVAAAVLTLAACGTPRVPADATTSVPQPTTMMPSASDFTSAVTQTRDLGTADVVIEVTSAVGPVDQALRGVGTVALDQGYGDLLWQTPSGELREISNDEANFLQTKPPDGTWIRREKGDATTTRGFSHVLKGLGTLDSLSVSGPERLGDADTIRYTGRQRVDPAVLADLGLTDDQVTGVGDAWQGASVAVTAWVDGLMHVVRIDRDLDLVGQDGVPVHVTVSTVLSDLNGDLDLESPASESVTRVSASATAAASSP